MGWQTIEHKIVYLAGNLQGNLRFARTRFRLGMRIPKLNGVFRKRFRLNAPLDKSFITLNA